MCILSQMKWTRYTEYIRWEDGKRMKENVRGESVRKSERSERERDWAFEWMESQEYMAVENTVHASHLLIAQYKLEFVRRQSSTFEKCSTFSEQTSLISRAKLMYIFSTFLSSFQAIFWSRIFLNLTKFYGKTKYA